MIIIDGSAGEGGGQVLRTALSLSMVTAQPFRIDNIRAGRDKPGLMRQHLTAVQAAVRISGGHVQGAALGSDSLTFTPGCVQAGDYHFAIGTAGSTGLVLQTVLPALMRADGPSNLLLEGGTHNPHTPCFDFLAEAFLPLINRMGPAVRAHLDRPGFYPAGGGRMRVEIAPCPTLRPLDLADRGPLLATQAVARVASLDPVIAQKELSVTREVLGWAEGDCRMEELDPAWGPGNVLLLSARYEQVTEMVAGFGERQVPAASLALNAARRIRGMMESGAAIGPYLADQLLLPLALAGGGRFTTVRPSRHTLTNIGTIAQFLSVPITIEQMEDGRHLVTVG